MPQTGTHVIEVRRFVHAGAVPKVCRDRHLRPHGSTSQHIPDDHIPDDDGTLLLCKQSGCRRVAGFALCVRQNRRRSSDTHSADTTMPNSWWEVVRQPEIVSGKAASAPQSTSHGMSGTLTSGGCSNPAAPSHAGVCELRPEASTTRSASSCRPSLSCTPAVGDLGSESDRRFERHDSVSLDPLSAGVRRSAAHLQSQQQS
jgi:hypothetical protein